MKKLLFASTVALTLGAGAYSAYASGPAPEDVEYEDSYEYAEDYGPQIQRHRFDDEEDEWFNETRESRTRHHEERIQDALDDGRITEDEATEWRNEIEERNQYEDDYGYSRRAHHNRDHHNGRFDRSNQQSSRQNNRQSNRFGHCH